MKTYSEKLKDPRWQKKRLQILERDNFSCTHCGDNKTTLHVHHISYSGNPWDVKDDLLTTLCESCHEEETEKLKANIHTCIKALKEAGFGSISFENASKIFAVKNRGWIDYEPAFDILEMAVDDDEIWAALDAIFWKRVNKVMKSKYRGDYCAEQKSLSEISKLLEKNNKKAQEV